MRGTRAALVAAWLVACGEVLPASPSVDAGDAGTPVDSDAATTDAGGGEASASCPAETCAGRPQPCVEWTFADNTCAPFEFAGNVDQTVHECTSGAMHLYADNTDDLWATASQPTPTAAYSSVRVAFRMRAVAWDGRRAVAIKIGTSTLASMKIDDLGTGVLTASLCRNTDATDCVKPSFGFAAKTDHLFVFELDPVNVKLSVDCAPLASIVTEGKLGTSSDLEIAFGHQDGEPFNGDVDDVMIWFKLL